MFILNLLLFILVLGLIIVIHELGHYYFAKKAGIRIHEFSLGMGPLLYSKRADGDVLFAIRAIPIGGYVSMAGEAVSDALIKIGDVVLLDIINGEVVSIHVGVDEGYVVHSYDLYGKDLNPLYIEIKEEDGLKKYPVSRNATYKLKKDKYMYVTPEEFSFESKSLWSRFLVIFGGPMMNFILAFVLYMVVGLFMMTPNLDSSEINEVISNYPAQEVFVSGDLITSIDTVAVDSWTSMSQALYALDSQYVDITYQRNNETLTTNLRVIVSIQTFGITNINPNGLIVNNIGQTFGRAKESGLNDTDVIYELSQGSYTVLIEDFDDIITFFRNVSDGTVIVKYFKDGSNEEELNVQLISAQTLSSLGYAPFMFQLGITPTESYNLLNNVTHPFRAIGGNVLQVFQTLGLLFSGNDGIGLADLSGPIGIFSLVSQTSSQGILSIIAFTAFLSVNIGLLNLLPIPALDGGRLVFLGFEWVTKKPLSRKLENSINMFMFYTLMLVFVYVSYHDILRVIRGLF
jgi:regulator of sigma E protease